MNRIREYRSSLYSRKKLPVPDKNPDVILLIITLILVMVGTVMIYSSSSIMAAARYHDGYLFLKKQLIFVCLGLGLMILWTKIPYHYLKKLAYPFIGLSFVLLVAIFIPHVGMKAGGAKRWLKLGFFSFQVSEMVKVAIVLFLAHFLTKKMDVLRDFKKGVVAPLTVVAFLVGLILLQPDFGTAVIIAILLMFMLYVSGCRVLHLSEMVAALIPIGVFILMQKPYRLARLTAFHDPWKDPHNTGFQIIQSLISFGSGGAFGVGVGDGMQKLFYLPEPHTDFIIAVIAEEAGFVGVMAVIVLFSVFIYRGFMIAFKAPDRFGSLLAAGLTMIIALEAFVNIAGVMGLVPLKGLALPFLSYGGTSLLMSLMMVGILLNVSSYEK
ncbi:MAG: putative lipid II flippase FtsW [Deltaproteobacteria bacterium]|nr:putative lipid II flippase FtsW [Deltaproteobacteria bacterium]